VTVGAINKISSAYKIMYRLQLGFDRAARSSIYIANRNGDKTDPLSDTRFNLEDSIVCFRDVYSANSSDADSVFVQDDFIHNRNKIIMLIVMLEI